MCINIHKGLYQDLDVVLMNNYQPILQLSILIENKQASSL